MPVLLKQSRLSVSGQVTSNGERLKQGLREKLSGNAHVKEVRGLGLIVGVQLDQVRATRLTWASVCQ